MQVVHKYKRLFAFYYEWIGPFKFSILVCLVLGCVGMAMGLLQPIVSRYLTDVIILNSDLLVDERIGLLIKVGIGMLSLLILGAILQFIQLYRMAVVNNAIVLEIRNRLYHHCLRLPFHELERLKVGGISSRLGNDVMAASNLVNQALVTPIISGMQIIITLVVVFVLNWRLVTAAILALPIMLIVSFVVISTLKSIHKKIQELRASINSRVVEVFEGARVVRGYCAESMEEKFYEAQNRNLVSLLIKAKFRNLIMQGSWNLMILLSSFSLVIVGGYMVIRGRASMGDIIALALYISLVLNPVIKLVDTISQSQQGLAALDRVRDVLSLEQDMQDRPDAIVSPKVKNLCFDSVKFGYNKDCTVLKNVSFDIRVAQTVAIVGRSGAGKTTLTDLIARFYDPSDGRIYLNGVDLRDIQLDSYRALIGFVEQDAFLFDGTVRENIAYSNPNASDAQIFEAAALANADGFIERLTEGYGTMIGERGVTLSGGQRQRISIARSFLANPEILILDEATSNLDTESEQLIQQSLEKLKNNRTTFAIAHRLSTVRNADHILVMKDGELVEQGTHDELLAAQGHYYEMVELQRGLLTPEVA